LGARTLVAMSGGVDSSVVAARLVEAGEEVVGVFMRNGVRGAAGARSCCSVSDARDARAVADRLGVPFYVQDLARPFARLIDAFVADYRRGRTPNPCVVCNQDLKFGELLRLADDLGCGAVATGHYARLEGVRLRRGADAAKDQSYLLGGLTAGQRARARFPIGAMTKHDVRDVARRASLPVADKPDSADICFVPGGDYRRLVRERAGDLGPRGGIVDERGRRVGVHGGVAGFTVGQRRGLGVALGAPRFVRRIDAGTGSVHVAPRDGLAVEACELRAPVWHERVPDGTRAHVQLRHHHVPEPVVVETRGARVRLRFERPSRAVTPGQYAVLYRGDLVLAGGRLDDAPPR